MATGGLALVLSQPYRFNGLTTIGECVFISDLVLFTFITTGITSRFIMFPGTLVASLTHETESLFFATPSLSIATILINVNTYGVPHCGVWLQTILIVFFWIYCACTFSVAVAQYYLLFTGHQMTIQSMTPSWILPIFPIKLSGTIASSITANLGPEDALPIIVAGVTFQGLGIFVAFFMYANWNGRFMTQGFPETSSRPGMFIAVRPPAFTALALIGMSQHTKAIFSSYTTITGIAHPGNVSDMVQILALIAANFFRALAFWFFCISAAACPISMRQTKFKLGWWNLVFSNVGFTIATIDIGRAFESHGVRWMGSAMTILLVIGWLFVGSCHIKAVLLSWEG
jgi:C4-dicarboxylate transporter/malic acid transport protein